MNDVTQTQITEQIEQTMSSADTQSQILAQLLMLTNQVGKLQEEVVDLRSQLAREPTKMVKDTTSATISATSEVKKAKKAKKVKPEGYIKKPATAFLMCCAAACPGPSRAPAAPTG